MQVNYQLDTAQLDINFIESIKALFGDKKIDITIRDKNIKSRNDTEYLLSNPHNAQKLIKSIENIKNSKKDLIHKSLEDLGIK